MCEEPRVRHVQRRILQHVTYWDVVKLRFQHAFIVYCSLLAYNQRFLWRHALRVTSAHCRVTAIQSSLKTSIRWKTKLQKRNLWHKPFVFVTLTTAPFPHFNRSPIRISFFCILRKRMIGGEGRSSATWTSWRDDSVYQEWLCHVSNCPVPNDVWRKWQCDEQVAVSNIRQLAAVLTLCYRLREAVACLITAKWDWFGVVQFDNGLDVNRIHLYS